MKFLRHRLFPISLLLAAFFFKGVFLVTTFPIFTGQDEARHYNTVQYLNQPEIPADQLVDRPYQQRKDDFSSYNFSEEILNAGKAAGIDDLRRGLFSTQPFVPGSFDGVRESDIVANSWRPYNVFVPVDTAGVSFYHRVAALLERLLSEQNILVRFYAIRILSVALGTIAVWLTFLLARALRFDTPASTLIAALVAFQPKFSMYLTNINYDVLLIPSFFFFTWGGALSLRDGLNRKNFIAMLGGVAIGLLTKGTAIVLLAAFVGLMVFHFFAHARRHFKLTIAKGLFGLVFVFGALALSGGRYDYSHLIPIKTSFSETKASLREYLNESVTPGRLALSSRTYWGALGWNDDLLANHLTDAIWKLEIVSAIGIAFFFLRRKTVECFPKKIQVAFLVAMLAALQLGIRAADWNVFAQTGSLDLGTPGRYFLPNLATHLILVFFGLGALLGTNERFRKVLLGGVILMFFFSLYLTADVLLPRFYL